MIPGNPNGQVWIAKDIKKIEPVARTSKLYPTRLDEHGFIDSVVASYFVKKTIQRVEVLEGVGLVAALTLIELVESPDPYILEGAGLTVAVSAVILKESPEVFTEELVSLTVSVSSVILIESPKINDYIENSAALTAAVTSITLV